MGKAFDRILVVMFENQYRSYVMQDPFMHKLASAGADLTNYFGVFHPSQTNYIASLAGEICGITNDEAPAQPLMQQTIVDLMEAKGVSWKAYMEGYPGDPWREAWKSPDYSGDQQPIIEHPGSPGLARYFRKHNAFASFHSIQQDEQRWSKIVSESQFWRDTASREVAAKSLPDFGWFSPDIWNDGHYLYNTHASPKPRIKLVPQASTWLEYVFFGNIAAHNVQGGAACGQKFLGLNLNIDMLLRDPEAAWARSHVPEGTLILITFDEADYDADDYDTNYNGPNQVYSVLLGDAIYPGTRVETPYNHFSLISTLSKNFNMGDLGKNDSGANWFRFLWDESFYWQKQDSVGGESSGYLAMARHKDTVRLALQDEAGAVSTTTPDRGAWSETVPAGFSASGPMVAAGLGDEFHLLCIEDAVLKHRRLDTNNRWSEAMPLEFRVAGSMALTRYIDIADGGQKLMLCWVTDSQFISYAVFANGAWSAPGDVGQLTDGTMVLSQLGGSLFLVYKERNTRKMRITSYNVAPFNAFKAKDFGDNPVPTNDTSLHTWSPADFPVGSFAGHQAVVRNDYRTNGRLAMASGDGEMRLVHRGAFQDLPHAYTEVFGLTGVYTAADQKTNGWGTLDQAGWTGEETMADVSLDPDSEIVMAHDGSRFHLVWRQAGSVQLGYCTGRYRPKIHD